MQVYRYKRLTALLLSILMLGSLFPTAFADDPDDHTDETIYGFEEECVEAAPDNTDLSAGMSDETAAEGSAGGDTQAASEEPAAGETGEDTEALPDDCGEFDPDEWPEEITDLDDYLVIDDETDIDDGLTAEALLALAASYKIGNNVTVPCSGVPVDGSNPYCACGSAVGSGSHWCCWNYAAGVFKVVWGKTFPSFNSSWDYLRNITAAADRTLTVAHLKQYLANAKPGAVLRMDKDPVNSNADNNGHSMVFVEMNAAGDGAIFLEGNYNSKGQSRIVEWSFSSLVTSYSGRMGYSYIKYIMWPSAPTYTAACTHTNTKTVTTAATCTEPATTQTVCSACGDVIKTTTSGSAAGHNYTVTKTVEPNCTTGGYTEKTCTVCKNVIQTDVVPTSGHSFPEWAVSKYDPSNHRRDCTVCGIYESAAHTYGKWTDVGGTKHSHSCTVCGYTVTGSHSFGSAVQSGTGTCGDPKIKTYTCSTCGYKKVETISGADHDYGEYSYKSTYHTRTCKNCGGDETLPHTFDNGVITVEPTMDSTGIKTYTCVCGYTKGEVVKYDGPVVHITSQPKDFCGRIGEYGEFSVTTKESGLSYCWQRSYDCTEWQDIDETGSSFREYCGPNSDLWYYRCMISDSKGSVYSSAAQMKVKTVITSQPVTASGTVGSIINFSVVAEGLPEIYEWQTSTDGTNWTSISCESSSPDTLTYIVTTSDYGRKFRCLITDSHGDIITSSPAGLILITNLVSQTGDVHKELNSTAVFKVSATGAKLSYRWICSKDGGETWTTLSTSNSSVTTNSLSIKATKSRNGYLYRCRITDAYGNETYSEPSTLILKPYFTAQPEDQSDIPGYGIVFNVLACGQELSYRWQYSDDEGSTWSNVSLNGNESGETDNYCVEVEENIDGRLFRCRITDSYGYKAFSESARLIVDSAITLQPEAVTAFEDESIFFTTNAVGVGVTYRWQYSKNSGTTWMNFSTTDSIAAAATYVTTALAKYDGRLVRCKVTDAHGKVMYTDPALITVKQYAAITSQPEAVTALIGESVSFTVGTKGNAALRWQYSKDGGTTWNTFSTTNTTVTADTFTITAQASYDGRLIRCRVTDRETDNILYSEPAMLTVIQYASISSQPKAVIAMAGDSVSFTVGIDGKATCRWQYSKDGGATWLTISSTNSTATTTTYATTAQASYDGRLIRCRVTDSVYGNVIYSEPALLTVKQYAEITAQPVSVIASAGDSISFTVGIKGTASFRWQYSKDGGTTWVTFSSTNSTATAATFVTTALATYNGRLIRCKITDAENGNILYTTPVSITIQ